MHNTVQLMITCILDTLYPETGEAVVRMLERFGVDVQLPRGQICCGQPVYETSDDETSALVVQIVRMGVGLMCG